MVTALSAIFMMISSESLLINLTLLSMQNFLASSLGSLGVDDDVQSLCGQIATVKIPYEVIFNT